MGRLATEAAGSSKALGVGGITPHVLKHLEIFLPPIGGQRSVLGASKRLGILKDEIADAELALWDSEENTEKRLARIEQINHEDRFEDWVESLPFPVASILWRHHVEDGDSRVKVGVLLHFFEALAAFLGTIHLSALSVSEVLWPALHRKLNNALKNQNLTFERATFGTWRVALEILSSFSRKELKLDENGDLMVRLYAAPSVDWIARLSDTRLVQLLSKANEIRNRTTGHGGAMSVSVASEIESELLCLVRDVRGVFGSGWANYELVLGGTFEFEDKGYCSRAPLLMGTRTEFRRVETTTEHALKKGRLYLLAVGGSRALELIPFLRFAPSPDSKLNACYFYSRVKGSVQEYVSYHFAQEAELAEEFADTASALSKLSEPELPEEVSSDS